MKTEKAKILEELKAEKEKLQQATKRINMYEYETENERLIKKYKRAGSWSVFSLFALIVIAIMCVWIWVTNREASVLLSTSSLRELLQTKENVATLIFNIGIRVGAYVFLPLLIICKCVEFACIKAENERLIRKYKRADSWIGFSLFALIVIAIMCVWIWVTNREASVLQSMRSLWEIAQTKENVATLMFNIGIRVGAYVFLPLLIIGKCVKSVYGKKDVIKEYKQMSSELSELESRVYSLNQKLQKAEEQEIKDAKIASFRSRYGKNAVVVYAEAMYKGQPDNNVKRRVYIDAKDYGEVRPKGVYLLNPGVHSILVEY